MIKERLFGPSWVKLGGQAQHRLIFTRSKYGWIAERIMNVVNDFMGGILRQVTLWNILVDSHRMVIMKGCFKDDFSFFLVPYVPFLFIFFKIETFVNDISKRILDTCFFFFFTGLLWYFMKNYFKKIIHLKN